VKIIDPDQVEHAANTGKRIIREALLTAIAVTLLFVTAA